MTDEELTKRFDGIDQRFAGIEALIRNEGIVTRRHFVMVAGRLETNLQNIADGHEVLRTDMAGMKGRLDRVETRQDKLEDRQLAVEYRQGKLEKRQ